MKNISESVNKYFSSLKPHSEILKSIATVKEQFKQSSISLTLLQKCKAAIERKRNSEKARFLEKLERDDEDSIYENDNTILHLAYKEVDSKDQIECAFLVINKNPNMDILKLNDRGKSALDLAIKPFLFHKDYPKCFTSYSEEVIKNNVVKRAIKPFLFHKDFSKYFMGLNEDEKLCIMNYFGISETQNDEQTINKIKESVIKDLGIADLAQAVLNHLRSEASGGNFAAKTPDVRYFLTHQKEWVDFVLFHQKIDNLMLQNKPGEAEFTKQIIQHLNLPKEILVKVIGGVALVKMLQKSKAALSKINIAGDAELLPIPETLGIILSETLRYEIGQFLSLEDIQGIYKATSNKQQILKLKEQQQIVLSPLAVKEHQEEVALMDNIIDQSDNLSMTGEDSQL